MSDGDNGGFLKELLEEGLNSFFGNNIDVGSSFIKDDYLALSHDSTTDADELLLTIAQVATTLCNFHV